jgi:hypothetical protein
MELIERILAIFKDSELKDSQFEIRYDEQKNVMGFVTNPIFRKLNDNDAQKFLWKPLKEHLVT